MSATRGEYKGFPTLQLEDDTQADERTRLKMSFGIRKAKLILAHLDDIKSFVDSSDAESTGGL